MIRSTDGSQKVFYIIGVSSSWNGPLTTYHVCELERKDAETLNSLRKERDEWLRPLKSERLLRGSRQYNYLYQITVGPRQKAYLSFLRGLSPKESGYLRSDKIHTKGDILEKHEVLTPRSGIVYVPTFFRDY